MLANLKLRQKIMLLVCIPLAFELLLIGMIFSLLQDAEKEMAITKKSREIVFRVNTVLSNIFRLSLNHQFDDNESTKINVFDVYKELMDELDKLETLCEDDDEDRIAIQAVKRICRGAANSHNNPSVSGKGPKAINYHRKLTSFIFRVKKEHELLEKSSAANAARKRHQIVEVLFGGTVLNVALALILVFIFNRNMQIRIEHLLENTRRLALGESPKPPIGGSDELAHLDDSFHSAAKLLLTTTSRQQSIFENVADVICSVDENGQFTQVSDSVIDAWQFSPEELKEMTLFDLVVADELSSVKEAFQDISKSNSKGNIETRMRTGNGPILNVSWSVSWAEDAEEYILVVQDITTKKQKEELLIEGENRLRAIFEQLPLGLIICNNNGVIKSLNPLAEKLFACQTDDLFDSKIEKIFQKDGSGDIFSLILKSMGEIRELTAIRLDSQAFPTEISASTFATIDGENILVTVIDITEKHKLEQLKKQFVAMVSHELKTPITSVQNYFQLLEEGMYGSLSEQGSKRLPTIQRNLERLLDLVNELVFVEKLESKTLSLDKSDIEVQDLLDLAMENVRALAHKKGIDLDVEESQIIINGDLDRLVQVLINFISNAIKFSPDGSKIEVRCLIKGNNLKVTVQDWGRGIPEDQTGKVFEKYAQVSSQDAKVHGGLGLGLAICKNIVELHDGTIGVNSTEGKGSTFWFELPDSIISSKRS